MTNIITEDSNQADRKVQPATHWELNAPNAKNDLIVKKLTLIFIALSNLAVLGGALYFIITYCPITDKALIASPFIAGVLLALAHLKLPTFGLNSMTYTSCVNPVNLLGRAVTYLFFGPLAYAIDRIDWTPYHDPIFANGISDDLENKTFAQIAKTYGKNLDNLILYGFINQVDGEKVKTLYRKYKPFQKKMNFLRKERDTESTRAEIAKVTVWVEAINKEWKELKNSFTDDFPHPKYPERDFSTWKTQAELTVRSTCFMTMTEVRKFKAASGGTSS